MVFRKETSRCFSVSNSLPLRQNGEYLVCPAGGSIDLRAGERKTSPEPQRPRDKGMEPVSDLGEACSEMC